MRELRQDSLTGAWVALCTEHVAPELPYEHDDPRPCPFCVGGAARSGPSLGGVGESWATPHRRPALVVEAADRIIQSGRRPGLGAHEVLLESHDHRPLHQQPLQVSVDALRLVRGRQRDLWGDRRLRWTGWARRVRGGHPVSTVVASAVIPTAVEQEQRVAGSIEKVREVAKNEGARWLGEAGQAQFWCAFAPVVPFEVLLSVPGASPQFAHVADEALEDVARGIRALGQAFEVALGLPHDVVLHQAPRGQRGAWYLRFLPETRFGRTSLAGVLPTHPMFPEPAAARLRPQLDVALCHDAAQRR